MRKTSLIKISRDLLKEKGRTFLVLLAMVLGIMSVAMMVTTRDLLDQNLVDNFRRTNPASFTLLMDTMSDDVRTELMKLASVEDIEIRQNILTRLVVSDGSYIPVSLFVIEDFANLRIGKFTIDQGRFPQSPGEMVIERTGRSLVDLEPGRTYKLSFPGLGVFEYGLSGIIHDPGQAPSTMERILYGYVNSEGEAFNGVEELRQEVKFTVTENKYDKDHIITVAEDVINILQQRGVVVHESIVPPPGKHVHTEQMDSFMFLLLMFGLMVIALSCFLIINMVSAMMAKEIRQIGIMKAIGADSRQITFIYLSIVILLGILATVIGTPLGWYLGTKYAEFNTSLLNFTIMDRQIRLSALVLILLAGIGIPGLIAYLPIRHASRITVNQALNDYGIHDDLHVNHVFIWVTEYLKLPGSFIFSIRNVFRRRARLVLTIIPLVIAGAVFMAAFNIKKSSDQTVDDTYRQISTDFSLVFDRPYSEQELAAVMEQTAGIEHYEFRNASSVELIEDGKNIGGESTLPLRTRSAQTRLYNTASIHGKWFSHPRVGDSVEDIVVNTAAAANFDALALGGRIKFKMEDTVFVAQVIGVKEERFVRPAVYMTNSRYVRLARMTGQATSVAVDAGELSSSQLSGVINQLESAFEQAGIGIRILLTTGQQKQGVVQHLVLMYYIYVVLGSLILIVGILAIISAMQMNLMERRREVGILKAMGMTDTQLYRTLSCEGITIGFISWMLAVIISFPVGYYLGNTFYGMFFKTPIIYTISKSGLGIWLVVNLICCVGAMLIPARKIASMPVNDVLAYE